MQSMPVPLYKMKDLNCSSESVSNSDGLRDVKHLKEDIQDMSFANLQKLSFEKYSKEDAPVISS